MAQTGQAIGAPAPLPAALAAQAAAAAASSQESSSKDLPRDARIIGLILASLGATDAEPGVVAQLLEFAHRYTSDILQSAQVYAEHAARPRDASATASTSAPTTTSSGAIMEIDDLRIAVSSKLEHSYSSPLPKEFLLNLASQINKVPLPVIPDSYGIRLPHERDRLTAANWDLEPVKERRDLLAMEEQEKQRQEAEDAAAASQAQASTSAAGQDMQVEGSARDDQTDGAQQDDEEEDAENDEEEAEGEEEEEDDDDEDDEEMEDALQSGLQQNAQAANTSGQDGADNSMNGDGDGEDDEDAEGSGEGSGADA